MKKLCFLLVIGAVLILTACGVSRAEHDRVVRELERLQRGLGGLDSIESDDVSELVGRWEFRPDADVVRWTGRPHDFTQLEFLSGGTLISTFYGWELSRYTGTWRLEDNRLILENIQSWSPSIGNIAFAGIWHFTLSDDVLLLQFDEDSDGWSLTRVVN